MLGSPGSSEQIKRERKGIFRGAVVILVVVLIVLTIWMVAFDGEVPDFLKKATSVISSPENKEAPLEVCVDASAYPTSVAKLEELLKNNEDIMESGYQVSTFVDAPRQSCTSVLSSRDIGGYDLVWQQYYILVAHYGSDLTDMPSEKLEELLAGRDITIDGNNVGLIVEEETLEALDRFIGVGVGIGLSDTISATLLADTSQLAIVPFESLEEGMKEVTVDGSSLLRSTLVDEYPLVEEVWLMEGDAAGLFDDLSEDMGGVNYDPDNVVSVVVTGTSVVGSRKIYLKSIEVGDWLYAWRDVGDILRDADIAHISNEASFSPDCQQNSWTMVFCGPDAAFQGLTWSGIDVVGLTGNHILDYGREAFLDTLADFESAGIEYFGGGKDYDDAHTPAIVEQGGMKFAFLGYNMIPPATYSAQDDRPGSASLAIADMERDITAIRDEVDFIFVDMQWGPEYERYPNSYQIEYGHAAIDAGADFVHGVHPHWVQPVEKYNGGNIFYSLGNFLFDQLWSRDTREGVMVRHYFYDGSYLGYEPIPTFLSSEMQTQVATGADKTRILRYLSLEL